MLKAFRFKHPFYIWYHNSNSSIIMKHHIKLNNIYFLSVTLKGLQNEGCTLYCAAKDLWLMINVGFYHPSHTFDPEWE